MDGRRLEVSTGRAIATGIGGAVGFSTFFLLILAIQFVRRMPESDIGAWILVGIITFGLVTVVCTLQMLWWMPRHRRFGQQFGYLAAAWGALSLVLSLAGVLGLPPPFRGWEAQTYAGLVLGNAANIANVWLASRRQLPAA